MINAACSGAFTTGCQPWANRDSARQHGSEMVVKMSPGLLRFRPFRQLIVRRSPWPRARIKAPLEMFTTEPSGWGDDVATLHALIDRVGEKDPTVEWPCTRCSGRSRVRSGAYCAGSTWTITCGNSVRRRPEIAAGGTPATPARPPATANDVPAGTYCGRIRATTGRLGIAASRRALALAGQPRRRCMNHQWWPSGSRAW